MVDKKTSLLSRYEDPTGEFSNRALEAATWYAKHRELLRKLMIISLVLWCVVTLGTSITILGKYFIFDYERDQANLRNLSYSYVPQNIGQRFSPFELTFSSTEVFPGIENKYDFFAEVTNPNSEWIAIVSYRFTSSLGPTDVRQVAVLPEQKRPLTLLGYESGEQPGGARLEVLSVDWNRIDPHLIEDPVLYREQRVNVVVSDFSYISANRSEQIETPVVMFSVTNNSLFDFWEFPFIVKLERAGQVIGVTPLVLSQFKGGETRPVSISVFSLDSAADSVVLEPLVNVFDPSVYMSQ